MRKYYVIYDHRMDSKHIPRNFYYQLDKLLKGSDAKKIQYSVVECSRNKSANEVAALCKKYGAKVKIIIAKNQAS